MDITTATKFHLTTKPVPHYASNDYDPALYTLIGEFYCGSSEDMADAYAPEHDALEHLLGDMLFMEVATGKCDCCGSWFSYGAVYADETGGVFNVGHTCAANAFSFTSKTEHKRARVLSARKTTAERLARQLSCAIAAANFLADNPEVAADLSLCVTGDTWPHNTLDSLRDGLFSWGRMSVKQIEFAAKLADEVRNPPADKPAPLEGRPVPEVDKRVTVEGTILSAKLQESYNFGDTWKMLVQVEVDGGAYKLWGSIPRDIMDVWYNETNTPNHTPLRDWVKGKAVRFDCRIERSRDDESFGFFSRPTKAVIV